MRKQIRRALAMMLCFALMIAYVPTAAFAAGTANFTIDASSYAAGIDPTSTNSITLPVMVTATNMYTADLEVEYDADVFESVSAELCSGIAGELDELFWEADEPQNIDGQFITLTMALKSDAKTGNTTVALGGTWGDDEYNDSDVNASATLTIGDAAPVPSGQYTATISADQTTVVKGDEIIVSVNVGGDASSFNSAEIVLDYDNTYLGFESGDTTSADAQAPEFTDNAGKVTIRDFGETINSADGVYTVTFTAKKGGTANVELGYAGFSTKEEAVAEDLTAAVGLNALTVTINHKVTVNGTEIGAGVAPNGDFSYQIPDYDAKNNEYDIVVKVNGVEKADPVIDENGNFTINDVTGDLVITYTVVAKEYTVTWNDAENAVSNKTGLTSEGKATHGTDITFDVLANQAPVGTTDGYKYVVTVTETADTTKTIAVTSADNGNGLTYTIDGDLIEADITITVTKEVVPADQVTVEINGGDIKATVGGEELTSPATVAKGSDIVLTLTPKAGYTYEVKVGDEVVTLTDNKYTIKNIQESVTITVTKTLVKGTVKVQKYLTLNGTNMWLVTIEGVDRIADKTYTYAGQNMFWSSKYDAYCYLDVAATLDADAASEKLGNELKDAAAAEVDYNYDVNKTGFVDVNDAQLAWNMYQAMAYTDFTEVSVEKFLRADVNDTVGVDSTDAVAIINRIKRNN